MQNTISHEGSLSGIGLHTGKLTTVVFKPAEVNAGVRFFYKGRRVAFDGISANTKTAATQDSLRCTTIGNGSQKIKTIEHLLAALSGLEICNIEIYTEDSEIPGLDGSALPIVKLLKRLGIQRQKAARDVYQIKEPIFCYDKAKTIAVYPDDVFRVAYVLDYSHPDLKYQTASFEVTPKTFETEIAPARTFCLEEEASALKKKGFGSGADTQNTLVFGKTGVIQNTLRFTNECARHKVLDIIGDTNLLGYRILGSIVGIRSGHGLNAKLVEAIRKQRGQ